MFIYLCRLNLKTLLSTFYLHGEIVIVANMFATYIDILGVCLIIFVHRAAFLIAMIKIDISRTFNGLLTLIIVVLIPLILPLTIVLCMQSIIL